MEQVCVAPGAGFARKALGELVAPRKADVIVLAVRKRGGEIVFNPPAEYEVAAGDFLIVMGERPGLQNLEQVLTG